MNDNTSPGVFLRRRSASDLEACEQLARAVNARDGYPPYMPDDDFAQFVASPEALGAWVATSRGEVVGHVALHTGSSRAVLDLAANATGVDERRLGVIARLLVAPQARRSGTGRRLLERAAGDASQRGLIPILDVTTSFSAAVALYERSGWQRLGRVPVEFPDGTRIEEFVDLAPSATRTSPHCPISRAASEHRTRTVPDGKRTAQASKPLT